MISPKFYNPENTVALYFGGKVSHYLRKDATVVLKKYPYTVKAGETLYTIARRLFGPDNEHYWTIIADINPLRPPDGWGPGEEILLPEIILNDPLPKTARYEQGTSATTAI